MAASVLVTDSGALAEAVEHELARQVPLAKHAERVTAALAGEQSAIVLVDDLAQGLEVVNAYAAEHLEVHTRDAAAVAAQVRNAGAVFVGSHTPVSLGDYCAGSNHVLPTGGCACHSSGLSVRTFLKTMQVVDYSPEALQAGRRARDRAGPGRGSAVARRRRPHPAGQCMTNWVRPAVGLPLRDELRGIEPYGAPELDGTGPAQRQREPLRSVARSWPTSWPRSSESWPEGSTATPTARRSRCAGISPPTSGTG